MRGTSGSTTRVRFRVVASARDERDARELVSEVRVSSDGGRIRADGPRSRDDRWWNVQVEIETPRDTPLALTTRNGGIDIDFPVTVSGRLSSSRRRFDTPIGGGAPLRVRTTNGGVRIVRR